MQRGLPAKGSQILPYKRLIIEADWVDSRSPLKRVPFTSTLVNRHDNGVVSEQSVTTAGDSAVTWAYFRTYYRMADLRSQELWGDSQIGMANLKDSTAIRATPQTLVKGAEFDMSVPQPSRKGEKRMQCRVGNTKPAFDVFASLTGSAVETHCSVATQSGFVVEYDGVWLTDYNVDLTLKYREESGTTDVVFRNISIEPNLSLKVRGSSVEDAARNPQRKQRRAAAVDEMPQICFSC
ncbi:hypothetical protein [Caballeronia zhejiangensis]|uniref:hypothetical protein n=1 Tax=Caballeronia zhejiangensis TaxID=871203 RepID=UPI0012697FAF|nr:hypothetical protein [Caballeronia zhejiangensis]